MLAILYYAAPNVKQPGFHWVTPGGLLAVLLWIAGVGPCSRCTWRTSRPTTRPTAPWRRVIVFLVWLWITNTVILLGAELNARARARAPDRRRSAGRPGAVPAAAQRAEGGLMAHGTDIGGERWAS